MTAQTEPVIGINLPGVEVHGRSIRVAFMHKGMRHRHTLGLEPTKANLKHAARLRAAAMYALKTGAYNEADFFPHSRQPGQADTTAKRLGDLFERYMPLKAVDITAETQNRYEVALNACLNTIGRNRLADALIPADIQQLRVDPIETRAVSTVNHYLAAFAGFLNWCEQNHFCAEDLAKHCTRFTKSNKDPDPFTYQEYDALITKGWLHPVDAASVTLAFYTGLRPGELCGPRRGGHRCGPEPAYGAALSHAVTHLQDSEDEQGAHYLTPPTSTSCTQGADRRCLDPRCDELGSLAESA
ncbi:MAG: Arm DNA-binding domain-containing protein [Porticoccaceae bacterium]